MRQTVITSRLIRQLPGPNLCVFGRKWPVFQVCGSVGLVSGMSLGFWLAARLGLSYRVMMALPVAAIATFLGLAMITKILAGEEKLIYYHHETAILVTTGLLLRLMRQPVLLYLDVTILGIGLFLVFGRLGCLIAGCCHGAPGAWGVAYRESHASEGFPHYLVGVALFPVQAVESLAVLGIVLAGSAMMLGGSRPGSALAFYLIAYGVVRFGLELIRGDTARPYIGGFSGAQWFSMALMLAVVAGEWSGNLAFHWWHAVAVAGLMAFVAVTAVWRCITGPARFRMLNARHVQEVAEVLRQLTPAPARQRKIPVGRTSLGMRISAGRIDAAEGPIGHFALSCQQGGMSRKNATCLARLILNLGGIEGSWELIDGNKGVFHLLVYPLARSAGVGL